MQNEFWSTVFQVAESSSHHVGRQLLQDFGRLSAEEKSDGTLVTAADRWADHTLREAITEAFPNHGCLTEENDQHFPGTEWCWVVDPLDGTTNFTHGIPIWGISIALLYQGTPVFGYVHFPPLAQSFHGFWGSAPDLPTVGAWVNHHPISPNQADPGPNQLFSFCSRSAGIVKPDRHFPCKVRMVGVASYNLLTVAAGIMLGGVEATPKVWDIAAVWVMSQAVGCVWHALDENPLFPLVSGQDYAKISSPTLVLNRKELMPVFLPLMEGVGKPVKV